MSTAYRHNNQVKKSHVLGYFKNCITTYLVEGIKRKLRASINSYKTLESELKIQDVFSIITINKYFAFLQIFNLQTII